MTEINAPIFQKIFAEKWQQLPPVLKRHYAVRENSQDNIIAKGTITVDFSWVIAIISPILRWLKILPAKRAKNIPITVTFSCEPITNAFCFQRQFFYPGKTVEFNSRVIPIKNNVVVEVTHANLGWKYQYDYVNHEVILKHIAYVFKCFSWYIPNPVGLLMGKCAATERAISDTRFEMKVQFRHPLFGLMYEYYGTFEIE